MFPCKVGEDFKVRKEFKMFIWVEVQYGLLINIPSANPRGIIAYFGFSLIGGLEEEIVI